MQIELQKICLRRGEVYYTKVVEAFGKEILCEDKEINRKKLANIIFFDKDKKEVLDNLTLNYIVPIIKKKASLIAETRLAIIDAPLLFETSLDKFCDITIGVIASYETCLDRICKRDGINKETAVSRISTQNNQNYFKINCDYCINNENEDILEKQIKDIFLEGKNLSNKNMIHIYNGDIEYLQFRRLLEYSDKIEHCYTLRALDFNVRNIDKLKESYSKICR